MRRAVVLLGFAALFALLALTAWWGMRDGSDLPAPSPPEPVTKAATTSGPRPADVHAPKPRAARPGADRTAGEPAADASAPPTAVVAGKVIDDDGNPLAGATVRAAVRPGPATVSGPESLRRTDVFWPERFDVETTTAADGMFRFDARTDRAWLVVASAEGRASDGEAVVPGESPDLVLALVRADERTLVVRSRDKAPIPGAEVMLYDGKTSAPPHGRAVADAEGRIRFRCVEGETALVRADGYATQELTLRRPVTEVVLAPGFPVLVRAVASSGRPVEGATVLLSARSTIEALTDAAGLATFDGIDAEQGRRGFEVRVEASGYADAYATAWAGDGETRVVLASPGRVEGVVVDQDGRPVADAAVRGFGAFDTTDSQGRFLLAFALPGDDEVVAVAGRAVSLPGVNEPESLGGTHVTLHDGETLTGVRVTVAKRILSFVSVEVVEADGTRAFAPTVRLVHAGGVALDQRPTPRAEFTLQAPPGTRARIEVFVSGFLDAAGGRESCGRLATLETSTVAAPGSIERVVVPRPVRVRFRLLGTDGAPVTTPSGLQLSLKGQAAQGWMIAGNSGELEALVDPNAPLRATVIGIATAAGATFDLDAPGAEGRIYELRLRRSATVRGRVVDAAGAPLAKYGVFVMRGPVPIAGGAAGTDGSFAIAGIADGEYRIQVVPSSNEPPFRLDEKTVADANFRVADASDVDVGTLVRWASTTLRGRVVGPDDRPVGAACVTVSRAGVQSYFDTVTDRDGRFSADVVAGAAIHVTVERRGFGTEVRDVGVVPVAGADVVVRLLPFGSVRVRLADATWATAAAITVRRASGGPSWRPSGGGRRREPASVVLLSDLPAGDLVLTLALAESPIERAVTVRAGETVDVTLDRKP